MAAPAAAALPAAVAGLPGGVSGLGGRGPIVTMPAGAAAEVAVPAVAALALRARSAGEGPRPSTVARACVPWKIVERALPVMKAATASGEATPLTPAAIAASASGPGVITAPRPLGRSWTPLSSGSTHSISDSTGSVCEGPVGRPSRRLMSMKLSVRPGASIAT